MWVRIPPLPPNTGALADWRMHRIATPNNGEFDSHMPLQTTPGYFNGRMLALHANDASSILALGTRLKNSMSFVRISSNMNYLLHYNRLIHRARFRTLDTGVYNERHHVLPRCLGGNNKQENIVRLLPEEHFIAHQLLVKIYPDSTALVHAAVMMTVGNKRHRRNKRYKWLREKHSDAMSVSQAGEKNSQYGTKWIYLGNKNKKVSEAEVSEYLAQGWKLGRWAKEKRRCKICDVHTGSQSRAYCDNHRPKSVTPTARGYRPSAATKKKISEYCLNRKKEDHPQYGKRWVNNGKEQVMVKHDIVDSYISNGYVRGRLNKRLKLTR